MKKIYEISQRVFQASRLEGRHEDDKETAEQLEEIFKVWSLTRPTIEFESNLVLFAELYQSF